MNQKLGRKRRDQEWAKSHLYGWRHDPRKVAGLRPSTRYAFALLSSIFHELMFLHKALQAAQPKGKTAEHVAAAQICQSMTLVRILAGKICEARTRMNDKVISKELRTEFFPLRPGHAEQWKLLSRFINSAPWLDTLRNAHAFHYPTFDQVGASLSSNWPTGGGSVLGISPGNCFFLEADQALMLAFFESARGEKVDDKRKLIRAFGDVLSALYGMSTSLTTLLVEMLANFVQEKLWDGSQSTALGKVEGPGYSSIVLPYFVLPDSDADKFGVTAASERYAADRSAE